TLCAAGQWPKLKQDYEPQALIDQLKKWVNQAQRAGVEDLALGYVRSFENIDGIVVGCETAEQVRANRALFDAAPLTEAQRDAIRSEKINFPSALLNPFEWLPR